MQRQTPISARTKKSPDTKVTCQKEPIPTAAGRNSAGSSRPGSEYSNSGAAPSFTETTESGPLTRRESREASSISPSTLTSNSPTDASNRTRDDVALNLLKNNKASSNEERMFLLMVHHYDLDTAKFVAKQFGWRYRRALQRFVRLEARRREPVSEKASAMRARKFVRRSGPAARVCCI